MVNYFILTFDPARLNEERRKLFEIMLANHRLLNGWSTPFPGTYFLRSGSEKASEIMESLADVFEKKGFFVAKLRRGSSERTGWLPTQIWDFLKVED